MRRPSPGRSPQPLSVVETDRLRAAPLTYPEVGGTRDDAIPPGYAGLRVVRRIGRGRDDFDRASEALFSWQMHPRAGVRVLSAEARLSTGTTAVLLLGLGPAILRAPVRVVYLLEEPRRRGFAYGTLPGHPESGEEAFVITWRDDDAVDFEVRAFSRPASWLTRLGGPLARVAQRVAAHLYLRGLERCLRAG